MLVYKSHRAAYTGIDKIINKPFGVTEGRNTMVDKVIENNRVSITGEIISEFRFSHQVFGEGFRTLQNRRVLILVPGVAWLKEIVSGLDLLKPFSGIVLPGVNEFKFITVLKDYSTGISHEILFRGNSEEGYSNGRGMGPVTFHRNSPEPFGQGLTKGIICGKGGFPARKNYQRGVCSDTYAVYLLENFLDLKELAFFMLCIAEVTMEVTTGKSDKNRRGSGVVSLPLDGVEDFVYFISQAHS